VATEGQRGRSSDETGSNDIYFRGSGRIEMIRCAWDDFQANRARDAVYGYLEAVFAIVTHSGAEFGVLVLCLRVRDVLAEALSKSTRLWSSAWSSARYHPMYRFDRLFPLRSAAKNQ
jgi:hypothetical protein